MTSSGARSWKRVGIVGGLLAAVASAGLLAWSFMGRAMFEPGSVARRIAAAGETLDPLPGAAADGDEWRVAPGITLHHFATGSGEDVVVVHGGPGIAPARPWRAAEHLPALRRHVEHHRGCGLSSRPITAPPDGLTYRRLAVAESRLGLAEQIADLERIRRLLGRERLVLVGHSFGALIAALYAAEFPGHVRALVLVAPAPLIELPVPDGDLFGQVRARLPAASQRELDAYLDEYFDFAALSRLDEPRLSAFFARFVPFYAEATGRPRDSGAPAPAPGGWMQLGVFLGLGRSHDWREPVRAVTAPVLVVHGEDDLQPRAASERIARLFPAGRLASIPGAGHFPFDEQPAAFAGALRSFLSALPAATRSSRTWGPTAAPGAAGAATLVP